MLKVFVALTFILLSGSICKSEDFSCEPNVTYKKSCNTCICANNGKIAACTLMGCLDEQGRDVEEEKCTPGETKSKGCDTCICDLDETWMCTFKKECHVRFGRSPRPQSDDGKCVPGTRWTEDCNSCWCTERGMGACTLRGCLSNQNPISRTAIKPAVKLSDESQLKVYTEAEFLAPTFTCQPGDHFKVDCNTCKCGDGKQARCSKKRCVPGEV